LHWPAINIDSMGFIIIILQLQINNILHNEDWLYTYQYKQSQWYTLKEKITEFNFNLL
jgi:hypothetical protein